MKNFANSVKDNSTIIYLVVLIIAMLGMAVTIGQAFKGGM